MSETSATPSVPVMDILEIKKLLPHRYPFLLVDRVLEMGEDTITGLKNVSVNEPFFEGHFPHEPIMPGVLQVEAMAQTAGLWAMKKFNADTSSSVYFLTIDEVKFRKAVRPGDQLIIKIKMDKVSGSRLAFSGQCFVDGTLASEAKMLAMVKR